VHSILQENLNSKLVLEAVDLADQSLPLCDEPEILSHLPDADLTPHYIHEHTRVWSAKGAQL
jgi:hypothetical protein